MADLLSSALSRLIPRRACQSTSGASPIQVTVGITSLALVAGGIWLGVRGARDAPNLDWLGGTWNVAYVDSELGTVYGTASIGHDDALGDNTVRLSAPGSSEEYTLSIESYRVDGDSLVLELRGPSPPSGYHVDEDAFYEAVGDPIPLDLGPGDEITANADGATGAATIVGDEPPEFLGEVTVRLELPADGEPSTLGGQWSYRLSFASQMGDSRAGAYDSERGVASGREAWERPEPEITSVVSLDLPSHRYLDELHGEERRRGEGAIFQRATLENRIESLRSDYGDDAYALVWLRIEGRNLPVAPLREVHVLFEDPRVEWTGQRRPNAEDPSALDVQVLLRRGVTSGVKPLALNGAPGEWHYDTEVADIRYVRNTPTGDGGTEVETVDELYLGELFQVELEYESEPPFDSRVVASRAGPGPVARYLVEKVADRPNVLRSQEILVDSLVSEASGASAAESASSQPWDPFVPAAADTRLLTADIETPVSNQGRRAAVAQVFARPPTLWEDALARAEACRVAGETDTEVTNYIVTEAILEAADYLLLDMDGSSEPNRPRRSIRITVEDHAAIILLRDEMSRSLMQFAQGERARLEADPNTPSGRRRAAEMAARTAVVIGVARGAIAYEDEGLLRMPVTLPEGETMTAADAGQAGDMDDTTVPLRTALGAEHQARWFEGDRERFFAYAMTAVEQARRELAGRADTSREMINGFGDCQVADMLARIHPVAELAVRRVIPRLLRPSNLDEPRVPRWRPDRVARSAVRGVEVLAQAIEGQEGYSDEDSFFSMTMATAATMVASVGEIGLALAGVEAGTGATTAMMAADAVLEVASVADLARGYGRYVETQEDIEFLEGLVALAGTEQLDEARRVAEQQAVNVGVGAGFAGVGAASLALQARALQRAAARAAGSAPESSVGVGPRVGPDGPGGALELGVAPGTREVIETPEAFADTQIESPPMDPLDLPTPVRPRDYIRERLASMEGFTQAEIDDYVAAYGRVPDMSPEQVAVIAAAEGRIRPERLMEVTGLTPEEVAAHLEDFARRGGVLDDGVRARQVLDYMGGSAPDEIWRRAWDAGAPGGPNPLSERPLRNEGFEVNEPARQAAEADLQRREAARLAEREAQAAMDRAAARRASAGGAEPEGIPSDPVARAEAEQAGTVIEGAPGDQAAAERAASLLLPEGASPSRTQVDNPASASGAPEVDPNATQGVGVRVDDMAWDEALEARTDWQQVRNEMTNPPELGDFRPDQVQALEDLGLTPQQAWNTLARRGPLEADEVIARAALYRGENPEIGMARANMDGRADYIRALDRALQEGPHSIEDPFNRGVAVGSHLGAGRRAADPAIGPSAAPSTDATVGPGSALDDLTWEQAVRQREDWQRALRARGWQNPEGAPLNPNVVRSLEDVGLPPARAIDAALLRRRIDPEAAVVGEAWNYSQIEGNEPIPARRVMDRLGLEPSEYAAALDRYLRREQLVNDEFRRGLAIGENMGQTGARSPSSGEPR